MIVGKFFKHANNTDVAMKVLGVARTLPDGMSLIVSWWNIVHKPIQIIPHQIIWVKNEQMPNWSNYAVAETV